MSQLIPSGFALAALRFKLDGDPEEMITTFGINLAVLLAGGNDAAQAISIAWLDNFPASDMQSNWTFLGTRLYVGSGGGPSSVFEFAANSGGTGTGQATLPANVSYLVRKRTALGGRSGVGRNYLPCAYGQEGDVNANGILSPAAFSVLQQNLDGFQSSSVGDALNLLHDEASPITIPTPIVGLDLQQMVATQRQRLRR